MKRITLALLLWTALPGIAMEWEWLNEMRAAVQQLDYQGEYLHRRGERTSVYAITHSTRNDEPWELLQQLDGDMIEVLRKGNRLVCYYPEGSEYLLDYPVPAAPFSQIAPMELERIARSYHAEAMGEARVAGRAARVIMLSSDEWRYPHKLWLDKDSHLLLQSEIRDTDGTVLEQFRYTRLTVGGPVPDKALEPTLADAEVRQQTLYRRPPATPDVTGFRTEPTWLPPMFDLTMAERQSDADGWMEKRVYSDGLATFSFFVEPAMSADPPDSQARTGATSAVMAQHDEFMVTVIGEVPPGTAQRLLESVAWVE